MTVQSFLQHLAKCKGKFVVTKEGWIRTIRGYATLGGRACPIEWVYKERFGKILDYCGAAREMSLEQPDDIQDCADFFQYKDLNDQRFKLRKSMLRVLGLKEKENK